MSGYTRWQDIRAEHVACAGGEEAVRQGEEVLLAEATGHRQAESEVSPGARTVTGFGRMCGWPRNAVGRLPDRQ